MNRNLLIVGGTGFIGQSILDFLAKKNLFEKKVKKIIITYSNKKLIKKKKYKINNISINYIKCNLLNNFKLPKAKYIIYCALLKNLSKDSLAAKNFCKFAEKNFRKSNLLYISSGAIYGNQPRNVNKLKENYLLKNKKKNFLDKKKNLYSLVKWKNEKTFLSLLGKGQNIGIARCFAFVGSRLPRKKNFAIGNFINSIINKKNIYLKAKNRVIRSYMYADDMAFWLLKIIFNLNKKPMIYNVGSDRAIDIKNLAFFLAKKYKLKLKMSYKGILNNKFMDKYVPDTSLAQKELGLKLNFTNLQSIYKTIEILNTNIKKS